MGPDHIHSGTLVVRSEPEHHGIGDGYEVDVTADADEWCQMKYEHEMREAIDDHMPWPLYS